MNEKGNVEGVILMEIIYRGLLKIAIEMMIDNRDIAVETNETYWTNRMQEQIDILLALVDKIRKHDRMKTEGGE